MQLFTHNPHKLSFSPFLLFYFILTCHVQIILWLKTGIICSSWKELGFKFLIFIGCYHLLLKNKIYRFNRGTYIFLLGVRGLYGIKKLKRGAKGHESNIIT